MVKGNAALKEIKVDAKNGLFLELTRLRVERVEDIEVVVTLYHEDFDSFKNEVEYGSKQTSSMQDMCGVLLDREKQTGGNKKRECCQFHRTEVLT